MFKRVIKYFILNFIIFIFLFCQRSQWKSPEEREIFLPTEAQISNVLQSKGDYRMLDDHAKAKGFLNAKAYHSKFASEISNEELQVYYKKYKPSGLEELGVEAIIGEREKIGERIAWYKIIQEVNLKVELKELNYTKVDWKRIPLDEEPSIGNQFAKVTVIEFSDFQCHFCSKSQSVSAELRRKYGKQIYWVFKDFPLQNIHEDAFQAHISANCVLRNQPEKYWSHFQSLFKNYRSLEKENIIDYIAKDGINLEKWNSCMNSQEIQRKITEEIYSDINEGKQLGIKGTPTFIINGNLVVGARGYEFFDALIQKELDSE